MNKNIVSIIIISLFCTFAVRPALSQNIVTNGDFEAYSSLPTGPCQINRALPWQDVITSCDYANGSYAGLAQQIGGAHSGTGYAGFATYGLSSGAGEAVGQNISDNPITGSAAYRIEFYAKKSTGGAFGQSCGAINLYGFATPPLIEQTGFHAEDLPGATKLWTSSVVDEITWLRYAGCFTTDVTVNYIVITLEKTPNCGQYVYIDDVIIESVSYDSLIYADLGNDTSLCQGDSVILDATFSNATYKWSDNSTNPSYIVKDEGTYWVEVSNICGSARDTVGVDFDSVPNTNLGPDTVICNGMTYTLDATSTNASYLWDDGSTDSIIKISREGTYWVSVTNRCGTTSDTIVLTPASLAAIDIGNDTVLCEGDWLAVEVNPLPGVSYMWQDGSSFLYYLIGETNTYWLAGINVCGIAVDTLNVVFDSIPKISFSETLILCENEQVTLSSSNQNATYEWQDGSVEPTYLISQEGVYWVEVMNHCGTSSDTVIADYVECYHTMFIPNSFSPNNDGLNDSFGPKCDCNFSEYHFSIFNRWGERIFETSDPLELWNGCSQGGRDYQNDVYIYLLNYKITGENTAKSESGDVTLLK